MPIMVMEYITLLKKSHGFTLLTFMKMEGIFFQGQATEMKMAKERLRGQS